MDLFGPISGGLLGVLLFGCFVQVITILSLLRYGLGLGGFDFGVVSFILSLVLSLLMVEAKFGLSATLEKTIEGTPIGFSQILDSKVRPFLIESSDPQIVQRVSLLSTSLRVGSTASPDVNNTSLAQLEASFLLSQLKRALTVGLILLIPLIIIDLMVAFTLTVVGIQSVSATVISIPLKLLLFVTIDGWGLIVNKLLAGFI
jgi:flagellar biosynthetic protein FliP